MRVALVHSFYRSKYPSGENSVVLRQRRALMSAGHEVLLVARHTDTESQKPLYTLKSSMNVAIGTGPDPGKELTAFRPDVVHVHNLFPNFAERWLGKWEGPLVGTLHNFRSVCANGLLFRDGATCTLCLSGGTLPAMRHACYRDSRLATVPLALHNLGGLHRNRLIQRADRLIVLSDRTREIYGAVGGESLRKKLVVVPNGIEDLGPASAESPLHWSFVGRLSAEKGVEELVRAWPEGEHLRIAGDGPLREPLKSMNRPGVTLLGPLSEHSIGKLLQDTLGLIFPSRWPEGFPTVVAEAAMRGIPIAARAGNSGADFVERFGAGVVYSDERGLRNALQEIRQRRTVFAQASRRGYESDLSLEAWVARLLAEYGAAGNAYWGRR